MYCQLPENIGPSEGRADQPRRIGLPQHVGGRHEHRQQHAGDDGVRPLGRQWPEQHGARDDRRRDGERRALERESRGHGSADGSPTRHAIGPEGGQGDAQEPSHGDPDEERGAGADARGRSLPTTRQTATAGSMRCSVWTRRRVSAVRRICTCTRASSRLASTAGQAARFLGVRALRPNTFSRRSRSRRRLAASTSRVAIARPSSRVWDCRC